MARGIRTERAPRKSSHADLVRESTSGKADVAFSMLAVVAAFVARRLGMKETDVVPQTVAWTMLGAALSAEERSEVEGALTRLNQTLGIGDELVPSAP